MEVIPHYEEEEDAAAVLQTRKRPKSTNEENIVENKEASISVDLDNNCLNNDMLRIDICLDNNQVTTLQWSSLDSKVRVEDTQNPGVANAVIDYLGSDGMIVSGLKQRLEEEKPWAARSDVIEVEFERAAEKLHTHTPFCANCTSYIPNVILRTNNEASLGCFNWFAIFIPSEIELDFERAVDKVRTHTPYCPNCHSQITKVLMRKKSKIKDSPLDLLGCFRFFIPDLGKFFKGQGGQESIVNYEGNQALGNSGECNNSVDGNMEFQPQINISSSQSCNSPALPYYEDCDGSAVVPRVETGRIEVERVIEKQSTHDLYCPNCKTCITKTVILRKRKRSAEKVKRNKTSTAVVNVVTHETQTSECHEDEIEREPDSFRCVSCCFSFIIATGKCLDIFRVQEEPTVDCGHNQYFSSLFIMQGKPTVDCGDIQTLENIGESSNVPVIIPETDQGSQDVTIPDGSQSKTKKQHNPNFQLLLGKYEGENIDYEYEQTALAKSRMIKTALGVGSEMRWIADGDPLYQVHASVAMKFNLKPKVVELIV